MSGASGQCNKCQGRAVAKELADQEWLIMRGCMCGNLKEGHKYKYDEHYDIMIPLDKVQDAAIEHAMNEAMVPRLKEELRILAKKFNLTCVQLFALRFEEATDKEDSWWAGLGSPTQRYGLVDGWLLQQKAAMTPQRIMLASGMGPRAEDE